tara:strand:- start:1292 stop:2620 length:1329 start_codon:yes stop_codon:yes gene_type:complete
MNWINKRKILLKSFLVDSFIIYLIFYFSNKTFYLNLSSIKVIIISIEWIILSYIFDRYYDFVKYKYLNNFILIGLNFIKTLGISFSVIISLKIFRILNFDLGYLHLYNFYFVLYLSTISSLLNFLLSFIYSLRKSDKENWIFIGNDEKLLKFRKEVKKVNPNILIADFQSNFPFNPYDFKFAGIIVDSSFRLNDNLIASLNNLKNKGINVLNLENWCSRFLERYPIDLIDENLLIQDLGINKFSMQFRIKRLGDIFISVILAIVSFPIVLISCIFIYLEDRGPIFYKQIRTGQYEKTFQIIKLRTMKVNAEDNGPQWSPSGDKRITKLGRILRLTRIDELPQLICVLKGEMSLIGPRPERPEIDRKLKNKIPYYSLRYIIRPGLSGWAQVNFPYGASIADSIKKFSYDIYYLKHTSILLDFLICIRTIRMVFNARGATPKSN